ncbi:MAG: NAD-dependent epimerase/dehydratase family protein [Gammaproteobacteria bacterium]
MLKPLNILVTGGLGFIGTNLIHRLIAAAKHNITVLDNYSNTSGIYDTSTDFEIISGDIQDENLIADVVRNKDIVVHLAAHTRVIDSIQTPLRNFSSNVIGTVNILEAMRKNGVARIINASTGGAIIGEVPPPVHEEIAPNPMSPYGASKLAAEGYCCAYSHSYGLTYTNLRFSNIYGKYSRNKQSVIAAFIKNIISSGQITVYGDGTQTRDYLYVDDLVGGIIQSINSTISGTYQLGSGIPTTINTLLEVIRKTVPVPFTCRYEQFRAGEIKHTYCNINKARKDLGYNPVIKMQEGILYTWEWYKSLQN